MCGDGRGVALCSHELGAIVRRIRRMDLILAAPIAEARFDWIRSDLLCRNEIGARWRNRECGARGGRAGQGSPRHALSRRLFSFSGSFDANCGVPVRPLYLITPPHMGWNLRRCGRAFSRIRSPFPPISLLPLKCSWVFASESSFATHGDATPSDNNDIK